MSEVSKGTEMLEKLSYKKKNVFEESDAARIKQIYDYSVGYMKYLDDAKTEREATDTSIAMAKKAGFTEYKLGQTVKAGDPLAKIDLAAIRQRGFSAITSVLLTDADTIERIEYRFGMVSGGSDTVMLYRNCKKG